MDSKKLYQQSEIDELKNRLAEAEEALDAIRSGAVDALIISQPEGNKVFTLKGEDYTYRVLVEQMSEGALTCTKDGVILYANRSFAQMVGKPLEKVIGSSVHTYILPEGKDIFTKLINQCLRHKKSMSGEFEINGREDMLSVFVSLNSLQIFEIDAISITLTDISELKLAAKLQESEARFRSLAENIPTLAWMARADGYIYWYNSRWYEYTGTTLEDMEGWGWQAVHDQQTLPRVMKQWQESLSKGEPFEMVFPLRGHDGVFRPFLTRIIPLRDKKGTIIQWFGTNTDISKQIALERQKDEFLGIASHELKTPVTSIKAYGQVLQTMFKRKGDTRAVEHLQKMDAQINKLTNLIGDLLDVTKIQSGRLEFHHDYFDFKELVSEIVEELQLTSAKHTIKMIAKASKKIHADRERIGQVLTNLISNAIKYSPHTVDIIVECDVAKDSVSLSVKDFGVGIPKDKQTKVFEQFFRVSGPQQSTFPGLGLGLYVSAEIIKREGGKIWVESEQGKGSTFYFTLPIKQTVQKKQKNTLFEYEIQHE